MSENKNFMLVEYDPNISGGGVTDWGNPLAISDCKPHLEHYCKEILKKPLRENDTSINGWNTYCVIEETKLQIV